jgi:type II secretory pathway predicted ATPase ExeA
MYESFFGLQTRPFPAAPLVSAFVSTEAAEYARQQLVRCLERGEGVGLLIGAAGTGKTQLLQVLAQHFAEKYHVARLTGASLCTRRALLQSILFELNLPYRGMEEGELRLSLIDHLRPSRECPHGMVLMVDEAHALPVRLLEEVRLITNLVDQGTPRVRLVLAGTLAFEERMASPKLAAFNQRVASRCYLHSMKWCETIDYVRQHLQRAGARGTTIFTEAALRAIHTATDGIPRLVNQLCDHAFLLASAGGKRTIDVAGIQESWADLQQLPTPWSETNQPATATIEFGALHENQHSTEHNAPLASSHNGMTKETFDQPLEHVEEAFDDLQLKIASLHDDEEHSELLTDDEQETGILDFDFQPRGAGNEVQISLNEMRELFGDGFEEEEIVIDRFAALDGSVLRNRPHVSTREGESFSVEVIDFSTSDKPQTSLQTKPQLKIVPQQDPIEFTIAASDELTTPVNHESSSARSNSTSQTTQTIPTVAVSHPLPKPLAKPVFCTPELVPAQRNFYVTPEREITEDHFDPVFPEVEVVLPQVPQLEPIADKLANESPAVPRPNTLSEMFRKRRPAFQKLFANLRNSKS